MGFGTDVYRWYHDRKDGVENPSKVLNHLNENATEMPATVRTDMLASLKKQLSDYHEGRYREAIPVKVWAQYVRVEAEVGRLNRVDEARDYLRQHGGPVTKARIDLAVQEAMIARGYSELSTPGPTRELATNTKQRVIQKEEKEQSQSMGIGI